MEKRAVPNGPLFLCFGGRGLPPSFLQKVLDAGGGGYDMMFPNRFAEGGNDEEIETGFGKK